MTRKYEYNKANLITGVTNTNNKNVKTSYRYSYYPEGNIAHYVNHYNATMDYTYDEFGNLSKKDYRDDDNPAYVTTYSYDKNNRLTKESQIVSNGSTKWQNITTYGYDKNGNRLNRIKYKQNVDNTKFKLNLTDSAYKYYDYGKEVYTYDGLNELKSYRGKNEQNATYEYMPNHYRISKTVDGTKTYQLWDNDRVVSEFDSELNMKINYRIGTNGQVLSDSKENLYSYDGHGNLVNGKDNSSTTVYDAYGNKTEDIGIGDAPFGYCGEYTDSESGFVYLRNRYYDPSTGSFITEDPIKDGNNWYGYCAGNPVNAWDTSGLHEQNIYEVVNNSLIVTDYREDLRVLLSKFNGVLKVDKDTVSMKVFDSTKTIKISDYNDGKHLINNHLHFSYSEFFDLLGLKYDKTTTSMQVTKMDEFKDQVTFSFREGLKSVITGKVVAKIASLAESKVAGTLAEAILKLEGVVDNHIQGGSDMVMPVIPEGSYVVNRYVVKKNKTEDYCTLTQIISTGVGNDKKVVVFDSWNPNNSIHSVSTSIYGYTRP